MGDRLVAAEVVELAQAWIGTPYRHQASQRGVGADCLGLIRGVWRELYGAEAEVPPAYTRDWGEYGVREVLMEGALRHMVPVPANSGLEAGQVLLFRMRPRAMAKHLGIYAGRERFLHAYSGHGVVDSPLSLPWRNRIAARFWYPLKAT